MCIPLIFVLLTTPYFIKYLKGKGFFGRDVHKKDSPEVAEMGGIVLLISFIITLCVLSIVFFQYLAHFLAGLLSFVIIASIGLIDDIFKRKKNKVGLSAKVKPLLCMLAGLPIILINIIIPIYSPYLRLPFLGAARIYYVYILFIPIAITVCSNSTNMIDVYNGILPGTTSIVFGAIFVSSIIVQSEIGMILSLTFLGTLLAYFYYNKNPSRIFSGDTGSLLVGGAIAFTIIMADLEVIGIVALIPMIINSFQTLRSIRGFKEKSEFNRPTKLLEDYRLDISDNDHVPLTLAGMILVKGPMTEKQAFNSFMLLTVVSSALAILTALLLLIPW